MAVEPASTPRRAALEAASRDELRALRARLSEARETLSEVEDGLRRAGGEPSQRCDRASRPAAPTPRKPRARLARDPKVRDFVEARLDFMGYDEIVEACRARFGPERAPSRSALQRWWRNNYRPSK